MHGSGAGDGAPVRLVAVDEAVLSRLVHSATRDADADDVTPRLADEENVWTTERVAWLRDYHRRRRDCLADADEQTWAVVNSDDDVLGSVRLAWVPGVAGVVEVGIWLAHARRGQRIGSAAIEAVLERAALAGADTVTAETTAVNPAAQRLLQRCGFRVDAAVNGRVRAAYRLAGRPTTSRVDGEPLI